MYDIPESLVELRLPKRDRDDETLLCVMCIAHIIITTAENRRRNNNDSK